MATCTYTVNGYFCGLLAVPGTSLCSAHGFNPRRQCMESAICVLDNGHVGACDDGGPL